MIKITDLKFAREQFGENFQLVGIEPYFEYKENAKTDKMLGYKYKIILFDMSYSELVVKIEGECKLPSLLNAEKIDHRVILEGLEVGFYQNFQNHSLNLNASAKNIRLKDEKKG